MTNTNNSDKEVSDIAGALLPVSQAPISQVPTSLSPATEASLRQFGSAPILLGSSILIMVVSYLAMPVYTVADEIGYMLRVTARLAFVLLILAYTATALMRLFRVGYVFSLARWLRKNRRYLGLSMALVHTVHFGYVVSLFVYTEAELAWVTAVFGGLAFVLMWLMALTSNDYSQKLLGANWRRLHLFGVHYLWLIFTQSFVGGAIAGPNVLISTGLALMAFVALFLRIVSYRKHSKN